MGMPQMPTNMPTEAHCQEERGINAEWVYLVKTTMNYNYEKQMHL